MKYVEIPQAENIHTAPFYFAVEEYVARHFADDDYFFIWQLAPAVVFGRNQLITSEVNITYCRENHINMFRRKSGGGCIYADMGNLMFSYITTDEGVNFTFDKYIRLVAHVLQRLGIDAHSSGRNDILVDGRKVAGTAFYRLPGRSVLHNTLLYNTNLEEMVRCITPPDEKLVSKGVQSVRQRVANLADYTPLSISELQTVVRQQLCGDKTVRLSPDDCAAIRLLEKRYAADDFIFGNNPKYTIFRTLRLDGVGTLQAHVELKNGIIRHINLVGDYFLVGDLDRALLSPLQGVPFECEAVRAVLAGVQVGGIVLNLTADGFVRLLFGGENG